MEQIKKIIPLSKAAKLSGYHQDYLSFLIRRGEIRAEKVGRNWFTTEEEIKNYTLKLKVRSKGLAVSDFLSRKRARNIFAVTLVVFVGFFALGFYLISNKDVGVAHPEVRSVLSSEPEVVAEANALTE